MSLGKSATMFDHAADFENGRPSVNHVRNGHLYSKDDRSRTSIIGSGNTYSNSYSNSFNDNSRRERYSYHETTHHNGPINNIGSAHNLNLGDNYGTLTMNDGESGGPEYASDNEFNERVPLANDHPFGIQQSYGHSKPPRNLDPSETYLRQQHPRPHPSHHAYEQDHLGPRYDSPPPARRSQTEPQAHTTWGSRNPYLNAHRREEHIVSPHPQRPPPQSAPVSFAPHRATADSSANRWSAPYRRDNVPYDRQDYEAPRAADVRDTRHRRDDPLDNRYSSRGVQESERGDRHGVRRDCSPPRNSQMQNHQHRSRSSTPESFSSHSGSSEESHRDDRPGAAFARDAKEDARSMRRMLIAMEKTNARLSRMRF